MADTTHFDSVDEAFDALAQALPPLLGDIDIEIVGGHRATVIDLVDTDRFVLELTQDQPS